jgi:hypothetical protein
MATTDRHRCDSCWRIYRSDGKKDLCCSMDYNKKMCAALRNYISVVMVYPPTKTLERLCIEKIAKELKDYDLKCLPDELSKEVMKEYWIPSSKKIERDRPKMQIVFPDR